MNEIWIVLKSENFTYFAESEESGKVAAFYSLIIRNSLRQKTTLLRSISVLFYLAFRKNQIIYTLLRFGCQKSKTNRMIFGFSFDRNIEICWLFLNMLSLMLEVFGRMWNGVRQNAIYSIILHVWCFSVITICLCCDWQTDCPPVTSSVDTLWCSISCVFYSSYKAYFVQEVYATIPL